MKTFIVSALLIAAAVAAPTINNQQVVPEKTGKSNEITEEHIQQLQQLTRLIPKTESAELREKALQLALNALDKKRKMKKNCFKFC
jgi:hypothetical protein